MKEIMFVVATACNEASFIKTPFYTFLSSSGLKLSYNIIYNNKQGLSKLYNTFITEKNKNKYIVFVHDDVLISDLFLIKKLYNGFNEYDIIGLAGTKSIVNKNNTPAWHLLGGFPDKTHLLGEVTHCMPSTTTLKEQIWTSCFGSTSGRVLLLDGLFIGINVEKVLEHKCMFDEDFNFHFYDLAFCLRANKSKLKMGIIQLFCIHYGLGESMMSDEWKDSSKKFINKYL
jgi:hypothetical protein